MTAIPSTPPIGIARHSRLGSPSKTAPSFQRTPPSQQQPTSTSSPVGNNMANFAQSTLSMLAVPTKMVIGESDTIQGSIERLAEKWEAKRKTLIAVASGSLDQEEPPEEHMEIAKQQRASIMEQKLQAIKQQGLPKKRSLLKPPTPKAHQAATAQKRLSLTDQVEAVGQKAAHKFIFEPANQRRKSMEMMISFSDSDRTSEDSSSDDVDDPKISHKLREVRSMKNQDMLPPYPGARYGGESASEDMSTYVPPNGMNQQRQAVFSSGAKSNSPHLVVKPINSLPTPPQRNMTRLPAPPTSGPARSLPQPPRSLPMPPTFRQASTPSSSMIRTPSTSILSNRSVYSVNKPNSNNQSSQQQPNSLPIMGSNRQLPQPNQRPSISHGSQPGSPRYQPIASLPHPPTSPQRSPMYENPLPSGSKPKPVSPYIVSVNSPPESTSPLQSPPSSGSGGPNSNSTGSNISTGSSSSHSSTDSPGTSGPRYTKVPPPRYRPHQAPLAQRRPLSGGMYQQHSTAGGRNTRSASNETGSGPTGPAANNRLSYGGGGVQQHQHFGHSNLKQQNRYGKSMSAESVLMTERQRQDHTRADQQVYQQNSMSYNGGGKHSGSSRSSSPPSGGEAPLSPEDADGSQQGGGGGGGNDGNSANSGNPSNMRPSSRMGLPQGPRRSSGMRMWQGQMGGHHQQRGLSQPRQPPPSPAPSTPTRKQTSRSPSPGNSRIQTQRSLGSVSHLPTSGAGGHSSRLRMASGGGQQLHQQPQQRVQHGGYQPQPRGSSLPGAYQRNSYGSPGQYSPQHSASQIGKGGAASGGGGPSHRRPSSLHSSPGSSRPSSPQLEQQRRRSSHYPPGGGSASGGHGGQGMVPKSSAMGPPPPYGARQHPPPHPATTTSAASRRYGAASQGIPPPHPPERNPHSQINTAGASPSHRNSLSTQHFSNNAKRQIQQPGSLNKPQSQQQHQQYSSYGNGAASGKGGLPAPRVLAPAAPGGVSKTLVAFRKPIRTVQT